MRAVIRGAGGGRSCTADICPLGECAADRDRDSLVRAMGLSLDIVDAIEPHLGRGKPTILLGWPARQAAERLGLDFEHIHCGFGELESGLANFVAAASDG